MEKELKITWIADKDKTFAAYAYYFDMKDWQGHLRLIPLPSSDEIYNKRLEGIYLHKAMHLVSFMVTERHRGQGLGTMIIKEVIRTIRNADAEYEKVTLDCFEERKAFYERLGFHAVKEFMCCNRKAYTMVYDL